jgi:hypothetical protein
MVRWDMDLKQPLQGRVEHRVDMPTLQEGECKVDELL